MLPVRRYSCKYCLETSDLVHMAPQTGKQQPNVSKVIGTRIPYPLRYHSSGCDTRISQLILGGNLKRQECGEGKDEILGPYCVDLTVKWDFAQAFEISSLEY
jgi:hypothetical protein